MAKIDWNAHKKRKQEEYPDLTVPEYARTVGLNVNTARKNMGGDTPASRSAKASAKSDLPPPASTDKTDPKPTKTDPKPRKTAPKPQESDPKSDPKTDPKPSRPRKQTDPKSDPKPAPLPELETDKKKKVVISTRYNASKKRGARGASDASDPAGPQMVKLGNGIDLCGALEPLIAQDHSGGYATYTGLDDDILRAAIAVSGDDGDLILASGRYLQMTRFKEEALKQVETDYAAGNKWFYPGTETPMPISMARLQAVTAPAQRLAEIERYIGKRKSTVWQQRFQEREQHPLSMKERVDMTTAILSQREGAGWSALETARELEMFGLELPRSLELEVAREVGFIQPVADTDGGITDEELETASREYMSKQERIMGDWLPSRRTEVAAALASEVAHMNGDLIAEADFEPVPEPPPANWGDEEDESPLSDVVEVWE